jgi:hypothetical protein
MDMIDSSKIPFASIAILLIRGFDFSFVIVLLLDFCPFNLFSQTEHMGLTNRYDDRIVRFVADSTVMRWTRT